MTAATADPLVLARESQRRATRPEASVWVSASAGSGKTRTLVYRVAWPTYLVGTRLVKIPFLGIVNILAEREVVKELIQGEARREALVDEWDRLMEPTVREALQADLRDVVGMLGAPGTHERASEAILRLMGGVHD